MRRPQSGPRPTVTALILSTAAGDDRYPNCPCSPAPVDSFWSGRPTFVQAAHVARLRELQYDRSAGRRKLIPKREDHRVESKVAAQCAAEAAAKARGAHAGAETGGSPLRPSLAAAATHSDGTEDTAQLLEHAATMLLFTRALAHERGPPATATAGAGAAAASDDLEPSSQ